MEKVKTKDSSYTCFSEEYKETYHSNTGALEESQKKFVEPCEIRSGMKILDICFGLGYNSGAAIQKTKKLNIIALEKDRKILDEIKDIKVPYWFEDNYKIIRKAAEHLEYKDDNTKIKIILGDARETIRQIQSEKKGYDKKEKDKFDAVFLDPFSPPKNPELWTIEFFKDIKKMMKKDAIMATYSCAGQVRRNLKEAGFEVKDGPVVGRRSPGTLAINI